jgi:hypothetical protein
MSIFFDELFEDGAAMTVASYTLFGYLLLKLVPSVPERQCLPLSRASLGAWRSNRAGSSRVGMVPQVIYHFADFCAVLGEIQASLAVLVQYDLFARPSEILGMKFGDIVKAVQAFGTPYGVLFGNADFGSVTKTGATDDVVLADSPHRPWCNDLLKLLYRCMTEPQASVFHLACISMKNSSDGFQNSLGYGPACSHHM